jgi:Fe-S-cluster containining protein
MLGMESGYIRLLWVNLGKMVRIFLFLHIHIHTNVSKPLSLFHNRIMALKEEQAALEVFPFEELVTIIRNVGFACDQCGRCCGRQFNGHVFLFSEEADKIRAMNPHMIEPPPVYDFCDQHGVLYVSGYTIGTRGDEAGSCRFLDHGRCRIYGERPAVCRIYPYMLHREPDTKGLLDWRQISGLDQHGIYHCTISLKEARQIAGDVKRFEDRVLSQEIEFLGMITRHFKERNLRHVRKRHDDQVRNLHAGGDATVMVYHAGHFEAWNISQTHAEPLQNFNHQE